MISILGGFYMSKALIAMSGGVDSSVAAFLIKEQGYECIGGTMKLINKHVTENTCCTSEDIEDARNIATKLEMPYEVFDFEDDFKEKVIDKFIECYENGGTPNPCIYCNQHLKFEKLLEKAKDLDCDYIVTGHYARIEFNGERYILKKALDDSKDQSYVLYSLTQEQLKHTLFPLGNMSKEETRKIAEENNFVNSRKKDSQDICFVPDGDYVKVIEKYTGKNYPEGNFVDKQGNILGRHKGIIGYTIGQRKGLGLALKQPMYVCGKCIENNTVILSTNEELYSKEFNATDFNWILYENPPKELRAKARIRYKQEEQWATIYCIDERNVKIVFDEPQRAIAKGQAVVLYNDDIVVGGGTII